MKIKLDGKRIVLRKLKISDANSIYENARDFEIAKYTTLPYPYNLKHAKDYIKINHRKFRKKESYELGVELKETKKIIGMMSLMNIDYGNKNAEIGYWL